MTDGKYYWRVDAADYVEHYGIGLDSNAINWMRQNRWRAPQVPVADLAKIDAEFYARFRAR